jgi:hypothetical protein
LVTAYISIEGAVGMICLKRKSARTSDGYKFWADNGREIVLSKMDDAAVFASEAFIWQRARVVASKNDDLTIEFYEANPPVQETISLDSSRINRTGCYKLDYLCGPSATLSCSSRRCDEALLVLITGLDLARRYDHENIVQWIEDGVSLTKLESELRVKEQEFFKLFFSNASTHDLDQIIQDARMIAGPALHGKPRHGKPRHDTADHGTANHGTASHVAARQAMAPRPQLTCLATERWPSPVCKMNCMCWAVLLVVTKAVIVLWRCWWLRLLYAQ